MSSIQKDAFARYIGAELVEITPQKAVCELELQPHHLNGVGLVQGGVLFTLGDLALAALANEAGGTSVTLNGSIDFLKAVSTGTLRAEAVPIKLGRTVSLFQVDVYEKATHKLLATFRGSSFRIK